MVMYVINVQNLIVECAVVMCTKSVLRIDRLSADHLINHSQKLGIVVVEDLTTVFMNAI